MTNKYIVATLLASISSTSLADGNPWLPVPGAIDLTFSVNQQKSDHLYEGEKRLPLEELTVDSYTLEAQYGISENLSAAIRSGYSRSDSEDPLLNLDEESGIQDTVISLTWRLVDEFIEEPGLPSVALKFAGTIAGDYDAGRITAIGDGADGIEASVIVGKFLTDSFAVSADFGYRHRDTGVADERFGSLSAYYLLGNQWSFNLGYQVVDSVSGNDIEDAQFTPTRFNVTEKDYSLLAVGANYRVNEKFGIGLAFGDVVDGRNATDSDVVSISFDLSI